MTTSTAYLEQPYVRPLRDLVDVQPGELRLVTIYHDTGCPRLRGVRCTCQPEIELLNRHGRRAQRKERRV